MWRSPIPCLLLLTGCWNEPVTLQLDEVRFIHDEVETDTATIATRHWGLACPDGEEARYYVLHDTTWTGPVPAAILLHGSAFDYVVDPQAGEPPEGAHYAPGDGDVTRLHRAWGIGKAWEAMGMLPQLDPLEVHTGALAAALVEAGVAVVLPINCWGDLWHDEEAVQDNDIAADLFVRNGRVLPTRLARALADPAVAEALGVDLPFEPDPTALLYLGLGDGGRGVIELLLDADTPAPLGVLLDSHVDDLSTWATDPLYTREAEGLDRIFGGAAEEVDWSAWSMEGLVQQGLPADLRVALVYSTSDPAVPYPRTHYDGLVASLADSGLPTLVDGADIPVHVRSNQDDTLARRMVDFLLQGR